MVVPNGDAKYTLTLSSFCNVLFLFLIASWQQSNTDVCCYLRYVRSAKKCIDLCVYSITCSELADLVVRLNNLGVQVRAITDREQLDAAGSQVGHFRMEG